MKYKILLMKTVLILFVSVMCGCTFHVEDYPVPCGYDETPYYEVPASCQHNPWTVHGDSCCTWIVEDFYSECAETWCYNEYVCAWQLYHYSCYPI